jgi:hypothetical protein
MRLHFNRKNFTLFLALTGSLSPTHRRKVMRSKLDYVYVMRVEDAWTVRMPGHIVAAPYSGLADAVAAAEEFASVRRSTGGGPIAIRIRRPEGLWVEIDERGELGPVVMS